MYSMPCYRRLGITLISTGYPLLRVAVVVIIVVLDWFVEVVCDITGIDKYLKCPLAKSEYDFLLRYCAQFVASALCTDEN